MAQHLTNNGIAYQIRQAHEDDAANIIQYSKNVFASTDQVLTTPEEFNMALVDEKAWIKNINNSANSKLLLAVLDGTLIGFLFFIGQQKVKNAHVGELGLTTHANYRAIGIGRALLQTLIEWAKGNDVIEKITLQVFATNHNAIKLYASLGFTEEGRFTKAIKQPNGDYVDVVQMYLFLGR